MQSFGGAAAGDGLRGAKAQLDASYVFHETFANVPEQGESLSKLPCRKQHIHLHLPAHSLCWSTCPVSEGGRAGGLSSQRGALPLPHKLVLCALSPALTPCLAAVGVRWGQPSLSVQVGQVGEINFFFCPSSRALALFHGSNSAQGIEIYQNMQSLWVFYFLFFSFFFLYSP